MREQIVKAIESAFKIYGFSIEEEEIIQYWDSTHTGVVLKLKYRDKVLNIVRYVTDSTIYKQHYPQIIEKLEIELLSIIMKSLISRSDNNQHETDYTLIDIIYKLNK